MATTAMISPMCEQMLDFAVMCGAPTAYWYPAMGGGTMAMCEAHGAKHFPHGAQRVSDPVWHGGGEPLASLSSESGDA